MKKYALKKDSVEFKKGTLFQEKVVTSVISECGVKRVYVPMEDADNVNFTLYYSVSDVEDQPNWFEQVSEVYLNREEVAKLEKWLSKSSKKSK